jgi:large subunit ribosomal protein L24
MYIRKGDLVQLIAGDDKGKTGSVLRVNRAKDRVVVEGCNKTKKSIKPSQRNPKGGQLSIELPVHVSNVLLVNPDLGKGVRIGVKVNERGDKVRYCRKTGRELGVLRKSAKKA